MVRYPVGSSLAFVNTVAYGCGMASKSRHPSGQTGPHADSRNSRADWIRAGLSLLMKSGIAAVRVEPLALLLGVTKGSFYWHFKDRAELHAAMLDEWQAVTTGNIIGDVDREALDGRARLRQLITRVPSEPKVARLETAVRSWATSDDKAKKIVASVDKRRVDYVASLLQEIGIDATTAQLRARIIHLALIGSFFTATTTHAMPEPAFWIEVEQLLAGV